jgi:hypothetical protein
MKYQKGDYVKKNWSVRGCFIQNNPNFVINLAHFECDSKWDGPHPQGDYIGQIKTFYRNCVDGFS